MRKWLSSGRILVHPLLMAGVVIMVIPYLWMITLSLKPQELMYAPPYLVPNTFEIQNYTRAWQAASFGQYYWNSAIVTAGITFGQIVLCSLAAYAFARLRFPGKEVLFLLFLGTMMVPFHAILIPSYLIVQRLGWVDT